MIEPKIFLPPAQVSIVSSIPVFMYDKPHPQEVFRDKENQFHPMGVFMEFYFLQWNQGEGNGMKGNEMW